jgi:hypothetical protein
MQLPTLRDALAQQPVRIAIAVVVAVVIMYAIRTAVRLNGLLTLIGLGLLTYGAYWVLTNALY